MRFSKLKGDYFVSIGQDDVYDPETFSGMFYRDERVVVVYSIVNIDNMDIIDKQLMLPIQAMCDIKAKKREYPRIPEEKYRIVSKDVIEYISYYNSIYMDI